MHREDLGDVCPVSMTTHRLRSSPGLVTHQAQASY